MNNEIKAGDTHGLHKICCHEAEQEVQTTQVGEIALKPQNQYRFLGICIVIAAVIVGASVIFDLHPRISNSANTAKAKTELEKIVLPDQGVTLPVTWGDLGKQMEAAGVIDQKKFESLYAQRGGIDDESKKLISGDNNGQLVINKENSGILLNLLWALGLGNKNNILERGPMTDKKYGNAGSFASTGGWILAAGNSMDHYSRHTLVRLTPAQQALVEKVSQNIYRPCCGNSTYFPDCNHGMAMLGLLELMASQNVSEADMYKAALAVNSYWFPDTYVMIAQYLQMKNISWNDVSPKGILSQEFSSAAGYQQIKNQVQPVEQTSGNSCSA